MNRSSVIGFAALAAFGCSRPTPSVARPQVRPESVPTLALAAPQGPAEIPTPQPAEPHAQMQAVAAAAAATEDHHGGNAAQPVPSQGGARHFGAAMNAATQSVHLGEIVNAPQQYSGHSLRVEGQVVAVCQHMGCWMEIRDDRTQAHVRMHGHSFFLPRDVNGHRAAVEAMLVAAHPPTECDQSAHAATGRVAAVELDALGVDVYD
jgi:hypothetical protein